MACSPPGSSVRGILQARILEWVANSFSKGSCPPRDQSRVSHVAGRFFTIWAIIFTLKFVFCFFTMSFPLPPPSRQGRHGLFSPLRGTVLWGRPHVMTPPQPHLCGAHTPASGMDAQDRKWQCWWGTPLKPQSTHACFSHAMVGLSVGSWAVEEMTEVLAEWAGSRPCPWIPLHQKEIWLKKRVMTGQSARWLIALSCVAPWVWRQRTNSSTVGWVPAGRDVCSPWADVRSRCPS